MKPVSPPTLPTQQARKPIARLADVHHAIESCERCPRLRGYCLRIAEEKKRAYRLDTYWGRPVPGFGDQQARLLLVGLAPAAHGANRTGRVFTGDGVGGSGDFLMSALHAAGFANMPTSHHIDDGLVLRDAYILAAVRCAPPDNKPLPDEITRCLDHLDAELAHLPRIRVVVALGRLHSMPGFSCCGAAASRSRRDYSSGTERSFAYRRRWQHVPDVDRLLSPEPAEHADREADRADAGARVQRSEAAHQRSELSGRGIGPGTALTSRDAQRVPFRRSVSSPLET